MSKNNNEIKHEDLIMKKAMDVFAEEGLKFFGINQKVKDSSSTEIVVLEALNLHMDYTFLMEDETYIHFEFQTTNILIISLKYRTTKKAISLNFSFRNMAFYYI